MKKPLFVLGGATGSGKTALAIRIAQKYPECVLLSADSRQIYRHLDIGSAKVGAKSVDTTLTGQTEPVWIAEGVPQYLIDIAEPNTTFTLAHYQQEAYRLLDACWQQGKVPLLVGGTGLYLQAVSEGYDPAGEPDPVLRQALEQEDITALSTRLQTLGGSIVETDAQNKRRLIRAIERTLNQSNRSLKQPVAHSVHTFVVEREWDEQRDLAPAMVQERLDLGLVAEVKTLLSQGIDKDWLRSMGLSYRLVIEMLDGEFPEDSLATRMVHAFRQLMRRQRAWFNRMPESQKLTAIEIETTIGRLIKRLERQS